MDMKNVDLFVMGFFVLMGGFVTLMLIDAVRHLRKRAREKKDGIEPPSH